MQSTSKSVYRNALPIMKNVRKHLREIGIPKPIQHYTDARSTGARAKYYGSNPAWLDLNKSAIRRIEKIYSTAEYTVKIAGNKKMPNWKPWHRTDITVSVLYNS